MAIPNAQGIHLTQPTAPGGWSNVNTICPPLLESLTTLDYLFVDQKVEILEAFTSWETRNKYKILNSSGQILYNVAEESDTCTRLCCGKARPCDFTVVDLNNREVLRVNRPFTCCLSEISVSSNGVLLGSVTQNFNLCRPSFQIRNEYGISVLLLKGPVCMFHCGCTVEYEIRSLDDQHRVGMITKNWSGMGRELFTDSDKFGINFPLDLDVRMKAVLLGACILIDFIYFEK